MDSNNLQLLLRQGKYTRRSKGQVLLSSNDSLVCLITKGHVKRYLISADGGLSVQSIYGPGSIFPLTLIVKTLFNQSFYDGRETYFYEAIDVVHAHTITEKKLLEAVNSDPLLYRDLLFEAGLRLKSQVQQLENVSIKSTYNRIAHQLVYFADTYGEEIDGGIQINLPITHQDLADILNVARETISKCTIKMRAEGLIKPGKFILITDPAKLKEAALS